MSSSLLGLLRAGVTATLAVAMISPAMTAECAVPSMDPEEIASMIERTADCGTAYGMFIACQRGASGDVIPANAVIAKCERTFAAHGSSASAKAYQAEREACRRKYAGQEGTMYVSFTVACEAGVALKYSRNSRRK